MLAGTDKRIDAVVPQITWHDLSATLYHLLGIDPHTEVRDALQRPLPVSGGSVLDGILA